MRGGFVRRRVAGPKPWANHPCRYLVNLEGRLFSGQCHPLVVEFWGWILYVMARAPSLVERPVRPRERAWMVTPVADMSTPPPLLGTTVMHMGATPLRITEALALLVAHPVVLHSRTGGLHKEGS